jgi:hypothetical protein
MSRSIVICSDGTGNTFDGRITNVTRLVQHLALDRPDRQVVRYDQGVGTTARREREVASLTETLGGARGLGYLPAPTAGRFPPIAWVNRARGLGFGYGLKEGERGPALPRAGAALRRPRRSRIPVRPQRSTSHGPGRGARSSRSPAWRSTTAACTPSRSPTEAVMESAIPRSHDAREGSLSTPASVTGTPSRGGWTCAKPRGCPQPRPDDATWRAGGEPRRFE